MKHSTLAILLIASVLQIRNVQATTVMGSKFHERLLTKKKVAIEDPYYQVKTMHVRELTDEEAMQFIHEDHSKDIVVTNLVTKDFSGANPGGFVPGVVIPSGVPGVNPGQSPGIPNIPPIPPGGNGGVNPGGFVPGGNTGTVPNIPPTPPTGNPGGIVVGGGVGGGTPVGGGGTIDTIFMVIDKLIAIGEKIIPTIEKGRPVVVNNPMSAISVLPRIDAKDPVVHDMGNWSIPVSKHYKISFNNGFGSEVVSFVYSITFQYGGTYNDKGAYLAGVRVAAKEINIAWGFDLDATSQLIQISNVGTATNVIAGATIEITYTVKNWTRNITTSKDFHVTGDGRLYQLD